MIRLHELIQGVPYSRGGKRSKWTLQRLPSMNIKKVISWTSLTLIELCGYNPSNSCNSGWCDRKGPMVLLSRSPGAVEGIKQFFHQKGITLRIYMHLWIRASLLFFVIFLNKALWSCYCIEDCRKNIESLKPVADEMGVPYTAICVEKKHKWRKVYKTF